jgi:hypothetical protein
MQTADQIREMARKIRKVAETAVFLAEISSEASAGADVTLQVSTGAIKSGSILANGFDLPGIEQRLRTAVIRELELALSEQVAILNSIRFTELKPVEPTVQVPVKVEPSIKLNAAEISSKLDRVKWAELLILKRDASDDARNSWLLNYGRGDKAKYLRQAHSLAFDEETQSASVIVNDYV